MIFGKDPWSQIPESWPQENICIKDEARQHKLSLHWDFCSKSYDALAGAQGGCLLSRLHVFQVVDTRDGRLRRHHGPSPVSKPHLSARCLTTSTVRKMCSETARPEDPDQSCQNLISPDLSREGNTPHSYCNSSLEECREPQQTESKMGNMYVHKSGVMPFDSNHLFLGSFNLRMVE